LRKQAKLARSRGAVLVPPTRLGRETPLESLDFGKLPSEGGVYLVTGGKARLYAGETLNLRERLASQFGGERRAAWGSLPGPLHLRTYPIGAAAAEMLAWQACLVRKYRPRLNYRELLAGE
jgi:excinuclease UvrABC nuclease subunit